MNALVGDAVATKIVPILHVWMTAFVGLIAFGAAGLAAITFLPDKRVSMMAAPLAGIALWPLATLALYVSCNPTFALGFDLAARIALAALLILSLWLLPRDRSSFGAVWRFLAIAAVASLIIAPIVMAASVDRGEPALLYLEGADHTVYAALADWYRSHPPQTMPVGGLLGRLPLTQHSHILVLLHWYSKWLRVVVRMHTRRSFRCYPGNRACFRTMPPLRLLLSRRALDAPLYFLVPGYSFSGWRVLSLPACGTTTAIWVFSENYFPFHWRYSLLVCLYRSTERAPDQPKCWFLR